MEISRMLFENYSGVIDKKTKLNILRSIFLLKNTLNNNDHYTFLHSFNVSKYAQLIGKELGFSDQVTEDLIVAGILHDIGKSYIPLEILHKPEKLDFQEYEKIKLHVEFGCAIIEEKYNPFSNLSEIIIGHHERVDGKGYPFGLKKDEIPYMARILAVADSFDAMTTHRPYQKGKKLSEAILELAKNKETQFDKEIVDVFLSILRKRKVK